MSTHIYCIFDKIEIKMNFQKFIQQKKKKKEKEKKIEHQSFEEAKFQRKNLTVKCLSFQNTRNKIQ